MLRAVEKVKPSSRLRGDFMDINNYVKIKIIDWKDGSKSKYINGLVLNKNIASRRMKSVVPNPRILLLKTLGQVEYDNSKAFINQDIATKIHSEEKYEKIT